MTTRHSTMNNVIRTLAMAAALAGSLATASAAQTEVPAPEPRSKTQGFNLGAFLNGSALAVDGSDETESGGGVGLHLGYGFTQNLSAFTRLNVASVDPSNDAEEYGLGHFDLGLRFSFGGTASALRPFLQGAVNGRAIVFDDESGARGGGFTGGGGLEYFINRKLALEAGLFLSFGKFTEATDGEDWFELEDGGVKATSSRFDIGVSWHP
jgi:hypothetical protein